MKKAKKIHAIQKEYKENIKRRDKLMRELEKKNKKAARKENIRHLFDLLKAYKDDLEFASQNHPEDKSLNKIDHNAIMVDIISAILELSKETNIIK